MYIYSYSYIFLLKDISLDLLSLYLFNLYNWLHKCHRSSGYLQDITIVKLHKYKRKIQKYKRKIQKKEKYKNTKKIQLQKCNFFQYNRSTSVVIISNMKMGHSRNIIYLTNEQEVKWTFLVQKNLLYSLVWHQSTVQIIS